MSEKQNLPNGEPFDGKVVEVDGITYRFERVPTGRQVWSDSTDELNNEYYSLRTWFSHSTENIGPGPGWDGRSDLLRLKPEEMLQRYGHVFTDEEVSSPSDMPDDTPYYQLLPLDADTLPTATQAAK